MGHGPRYSFPIRARCSAEPFFARRSGPCVFARRCGGYDEPDAACGIGALTVVGSRADRDFTQFPAVPVELPRYSDLALGASIEVAVAEAGRPGFVVELRAENVLDQDFEQVFGFLSPGRALYVKGTLTFGGERR